MSRLPLIAADDARRRLESGEAMAIDIREADEFAREHIPGAVSAPAATLATAAFDTGRTAIFTCRSGMRTQANAAALAACGFREAYCLEGGIEAWKSAGNAVAVDSRAPLELMRQVQIAAGALVLTGALLGWLVWPGFLALAAFVGGGLLFAGISGWCGMALLLRRMPWNRRQAAGA